MADSQSFILENGKQWIYCLLFKHFKSLTDVFTFSVLFFLKLDILSKILAVIYQLVSWNGA